jgi:hypothetical protein
VTGMASIPSAYQGSLLGPRRATSALFRRDRSDSGPEPDPSLCRGNQAWAEALSTMRLMTGKRAGTLLELMHPIEYFTLCPRLGGPDR